MDKTTEQIPSQNNLKQIINDITSNTTITQKVLESVIGVVGAIGANSKLDQAIKSERKLKRFKKAMSSYCDLMNDVIKTIIRPYSEGENLSELLGYVNYLEEDEEDPKRRKKVEKYTVVEAAMQIPKIIIGSIDVLQKIVDFKSGFFTFRKIKKNIKLLGYVMRETFTMMIDIFKNLASKEEIRDLVDSLVKQPDVVEDYMYSTSEQTGEFQNTSLSDTKKITKQGKLGLLDVFTQTFNIISTLTNLKTPNLIMVEFRLLKVRYVLRRILKHLIKFGDKNVNESTNTSIQNIAELIAGDGNEGKKIGLFGLFKKMAMMPLFIEKANIPAKNMRRFKKSIKFLSNIINNIKDLLDSEAISNIDDRDKIKKLEALKKITDELLEISINLRRLGFIGLIARILRPAILGILNSIDIIVDKINKVFNKEVSAEAVKNIDSINSVISSLIKLSSKIILLGLIAIPALVFGIVAMIFLFFLSIVLWAILGITKLFPSKLVVEIREDLSDISTLFITLTIVGAAICLLALMTPTVIKSLLEVILFIGVLLIFVIAVAGVFWLADLILSKLKGKIYSVIGMILALTGMLLVCAIVLLLLTKIAQKIVDMDGVGTIIAFVLGLTVFVFAMAGLGLALGNIFVLGGLGMVATGLGAMLGVLVTLVSIAKAINAISEIDVNTTKCMASVELVLDFMSDLKVFFDKKKEEIGEEDDWENLEDILDEARLVTKRIFQIADILKQIQLLELDRKRVLKSVRLVFDTIVKIHEEVEKNEKLGTNSEDDNESYWEDLEDILDEVVEAFEEFEEITNVVNQINNLKLDKKTIIDNVNLVFDTITQINEEVQKNATLGNEDYWDDLEDVLDEVVEVAEHIGSITDVLNGINNLKLSENQIKDKITSIFNLVETINDQCAKSNALKKEDVGWFEDDSKEIAAEEMGKVAAIAEGIGTIVETLNSIVEIDLNAELIRTKITDLFDFIDNKDNGLMKIIQDSTALQPEERDLWDVLCGNKDSKETNVEELNKISAIMESIGTITEVLNSISKAEFNKAAISTKITEIFNVVDEVDRKLKSELSKKATPEEIKTQEELFKQLYEEAKNEKNNSKKMSKVASVLQTVGTIIDALNKIGEFKFSSTKITNKLDTIFNIIENINTKVKTALSSEGATEKTDIVSIIEPAAEAMEILGEGLSSISEPNPDTARKNIDNYIRFIDKASKIDVQKIETSTKMFEQMSNFSNSIKGDFDKLAETLGEKLLPVLEDLKEVMGVIPEKIESSSQNISASVAASNAPATRENVEAQVNRENPNMTKEEVTKVVDTRMAEKAKSDSNGVAAKLDELISLLKGYGGENVVVQTV